MLVVGLLVIAATGADDKKKQAYYLKPDQTVDLAEPKTVTAKQNCENWALAAGLEAMLRQQNAGLSQTFWILRLYGGELCESRLPAMEALAKDMGHEFVLDYGRHVRLQLNFVPGAPSNVDALIMGLKQQQISLILLRGHPYYLTGATYDERIRLDGGRVFVLKELRLSNTFAGQPGVTFENGRDSLEDIQGVLSATVTVVPVQEWK